MKYIPLSIKGLLFGLVITFIAWVVLDRQQTASLTDLLNEHLIERMADELVSARTRLHEHIEDHLKFVQNLSSQVNFKEHLLQDTDQDDQAIELYTNIPLSWNIPKSLWLNNITPNYIMTFDEAMRPVELVNLQGNDFPDGIKNIEPLSISLSLDDAYITSIDGKVFLLSSIELTDRQGYLLVASELNQHFLMESQKRVLLNGRVLVLFSGENKKILTATTSVTRDLLSKNYIKGGSSFFDYGSSDIRLQLSIYIPKSISSELSHDILMLTRQQRLTAIIVVLVLFSLWIQYHASEISQLRKQVFNFAKETFGTQHTPQRSLDEIDYLKKTFSDLQQQLITQNDLEKEAHKVEEERIKIDMLNSITKSLKVGLLLREGKSFIALNKVMEGFEKECRPLMKLALDKDFLDYETIDCRGKERCFDIKKIMISEDKEAILIQDVTVLNAKTKRLEHQASHDVLTGLANRLSFDQSLHHMLDTSHGRDKKHALVFMDLDKFKIINDQCGHAAGDLLLQQLSQIFQNKIRQSDILARIGGDEFGLILPFCSKQRSQQIMQEIIDAVLAFQFVWENQSFQVGISVGITAFGVEGDYHHDVLSSADSACYIAKESGGNQYHFYQTDDEQIIKELDSKLNWLEKLSHGIEKNRFLLYVQPIASLKANKCISGYEVLVRYQHQDGEISAAQDFIELTERYKLIEALDLWVIEETLSWLDVHGDQDSEMFLTINISGKNLGSDRFTQTLIEKLNLSKELVKSLCFEISEASAVRDFARTNYFIKRIKALGGKISIDDFGSGMSPFTYLKQLPVDQLKMDDVFIKTLISKPDEYHFIRSMTDMGHSLDMEIMAKCVESPEVIEILKQTKVDYIQGSVISHPFPLKELTLKKS